MTAAMPAVEPYVMALCRPATRTIFDAQGQPDAGILDANIAVYCDLIARAAGEHGAKLIVFPQFALTGYTPLGTDGWLGASLTFPGPEMDRIGAAARAAGAHVVIQTAERHAAFPGRYFLSAAILKPDGGIGLAYRKNYAMSLRTSPIDVFDRFVETFGPDAFLPVLDTSIGVLGVAIGAEVHWPEPIRAMALKGAEIILNPVAAMQGIDYMNRPGAEIVRPVRAFENMVYLGMANMADGCVASQAYDFEGRAIGQAVGDGSCMTLATIDIEALRKARIFPAANFLTQIQPAIQEDARTLPLWPANAFAHLAPRQFEELMAVENEVWRQMQALGRGTAPATR
ncbi:MAG: nitrilase-related carbon-nitrogen hydrolase [Sphingobium sp.]